RGVKPGARADEREAAPHAETDDPHLRRAVASLNQPLARRLDVAVGASGTAEERSHRGHDAAFGTAGRVEVDGEREIASTGQSLGVTAHDLVDPEDLMNENDAGPRAGTFGPGDVAPQRARTVACSGENTQVDVVHRLT